MEPMFYCPRLAAAGAHVTLDGDEAYHACTTRRHGEGDQLWLFDGHGGIARANISTVDRSARVLRLEIEERQLIPPPRRRVELACAVPKGERQAMLLDMATQLGMTAFRPLFCARSVVKPGTNAVERWRRICIEACKQSRRAYLPDIYEPVELSKLLGLAKSAYAVCVAHPGAASHARTALAPTADPRALLLIAGPEGGFTDAEITEMVRTGAQLINLGSVVLRTETAAVALLAYAALAAGP
jgi:16S rRNA (uracil1498-N3)-methyltransferase